jgi:hypothetical protein
MFRRDRDARHERERIAREHERPIIPVLAGNAGVDEDVLQLARAAAAGRLHGQAGGAEAEMKIEAWLEVRGRDIAAACAGRNLERRRRPLISFLGDDLHGLTHDT